MAKVLNIVESKFVHKDGKMKQRVIFSDDKIVYVDNDTGDVVPDSTPDKYVELISMYNATHTHFELIDDESELESEFDSCHSDEYESMVRPRPNSLRKTAVILDTIVVAVAALNIVASESDGGAWAVVTFVWLMMTIAVQHSISDDKEHIVLGILHLLCFNPVSGILILISNGQVGRDMKS
jgi:hypothetical protein